MKSRTFLSIEVFGFNCLGGLEGLEGLEGWSLV